MTEFGKTLREAREARGLTAAQIADQTHLLPQIVEDLEAEDFHRISAPIYGRGFVKLYCEAVGLEPKPLVDEFMAILNGEREPAIRMRDVELPPDEPAEPAMPAEPPERPKPVVVQPDLEPNAQPTDFAFEPLSPPTPARTPPPVPPAATAAFGEPPAPESRQYHPDYTRTPTEFAPSVNIGRLAILSVGAIVVLTLLILGGRALYRATMTVPGEESKAKVVDAAASPRPTEEKTKPKNADAAASPRPTEKKSTVKRTPKDVPPLYID